MTWLSLGSMVNSCTDIAPKEKLDGARRVNRMVSASSMSASSLIPTLKRGFSPDSPGTTFTDRLSARALPSYRASLRSPAISISTAKPSDEMMYPFVSISMMWLPTSSNTKEADSAKPIVRSASLSRKATVCITIPSSWLMGSELVVLSARVRTSLSPILLSSFLALTVNVTLSRLTGRVMV